MNQHYSYFLITLLFFFVTTLSAFENDETKNTTDTTTGNVVFLDDKIQHLSGLETKQLNRVSLQTESIAFAKAINITPLLNIRNQYFIYRAQSTAAKARYQLTEKEIVRLQKLHQLEAVSTRALQQQQSLKLSDITLYKTSQYQMQLLINKCKLKWGDKLTQWLTDENNTQFNQLLAAQSTLLLVTLPVNKASVTPRQSIYISNTGSREKAVLATYVSAIPVVDPMSQGSQYVFLTTNPSIKPGMALSAWIPQNQQTQGFVVPKSAFIWHLGQVFVYVKIDKEQFIRRPIYQAVAVAEGYFVADQINHGEEIVTKGAQMLLSQEFKAQIPDEDDD